MPSLCAVSGCSIFIASSTTIVSPAETRWPSSATILAIVPCMGLTRASPPAADAGPRSRRPAGRPRSRPGTCPGWPAAASPAGSTTSSRLPPTSTTTRSRPGSAGAPAGSAEYGAIVAANSVSIHRVCTRNGSSVKAGSATTARWNGSTVGSPPTSNSASARRALASACRRLAPVMISLPMSESNACGTVMPAV